MPDTFAPPIPILPRTFHEFRKHSVLLNLAKSAKFLLTISLCRRQIVNSILLRLFAASLPSPLPVSSFRESVRPSVSSLITASIRRNDILEDGSQVCLKYAILSGSRGEARRGGGRNGAMKYREMRLSRVDGAKRS